MVNYALLPGNTVARVSVPLKKHGTIRYLQRDSGGHVQNTHYSDIKVTTVCFVHSTGTNRKTAVKTRSEYIEHSYMHDFDYSCTGLTYIIVCDFIHPSH